MGDEEREKRDWKEEEIIKVSKEDESEVIDLEKVLGEGVPKQKACYHGENLNS